MKRSTLNHLKNQLLGGWGVTRLLRLGLGIFVLVQAFVVADLLLGLMGTVLVIQAVLNAGCCGSQGCGTGHLYRKQGSAEAPREETTFEEIK